jgi:outer membrane protein
MTKTPRWIALAAAAAAATALTPVHAQDSGSLLLRAKLTHLEPVNSDNVAPLDLSVNAKTFPTLDIVYFLTPNLAAELILTVPQRHNVRDAALGRIGSISHLPPTLSVQYHFTGMQGLRPYVGVGLNFTRLTDVNLDIAGASLRRNSFGLALGAGVDVPLGGGWLIGADLKKVQIDTDVRLNGAKLGTFEINPWLFSVGVGRRF